MTVSSIRVRLPTKFPASVTATSPLTLSQTGGNYVFGLSVTALQVTFDQLYVPQTQAGFIQPHSYPVTVTSGHSIPYLDGDAQFGNAYSQYPLGAVSTNPIIIGKAGSSIGSSTNGQTFKIVFTSAGLTGSPITITYTAGAAETVNTVAAGLAALVNANPVLHGTGGKPIFMQASGTGGLFNLQYDSAFSATGATPLTTATTGSTGTITLASETDALDFVVMQLGRNATGHTGKAGDALYALDFTGQDSTGSFNTHYAQMSVTATVATAGATRGTINFTTANNSSLLGRVAIKEGLCLFDSSGVLPTSGDLGPGTLNIPSVGKYSIDNTNNIRRSAGSAQFIIESTADDIVISSSGAGGLGFNLTPTGQTISMGLGAFVSGVQVPTTGSGISLAGGLTPVLSARNYGSSTALPLKISASNVALGAAGSLIPIVFANATSGTITLQPVTGALGSVTLSLPAATDTLVGKSTTDVLTNKTLTGTATNDSAGVGIVGEIITATVLVGSAVSLSNGVAANITSISLTAGDWDVAGNICFHPAGTTTWTVAHAWTSTVSATAPTAPNNGAYTQIGAPMTTGADQFLTVGTQRISIAGTTTVFLSALTGFATSTMQGYGFIRARRVR